MNTPFTVDELVLKKGMTIMDACMIVWNVTEEAFADYLRSKRTLSTKEVEEIEHRHDADRGLFVQPVHHCSGESRH